MQRTIFDDDHHAFRQTIRQFFEKEVVPEYAAWEQQGHPPKDFYRRMGELGFLGLQVPEQYGGAGVESFTFNAIINEESVRAGLTLGPLRVHLDLVLPYLVGYANGEQKSRWLPAFVAGEMMTAIAMTEPGTGSDLAGIRTSARLDGDHYILNGAKTFITGGVNADRVLVVCRTSPPGTENRRSGLTILAVDSASPGFEVGRMLDKMGLKAQDTCELSFTDVRVPVEDRLGEEGRAFEYLTHNLAQERLTIAVTAVAAAHTAIDLAKAYTQERAVFGKPVAAFQNTKFVLAECAADAAAGQAYLDHALELHDRRELTPADAAALKLWTTEMQARVVDKCLQLHGGYGYMNEYLIAKLYADARVTRIYGGTSEVMKSIVAKSMGL
ncbi:acyl-CoA dehydrogenase family protein [Pseudonocardia sp. DSM 110487]|uniref:acyl-CoA dehydrogenase family protein n=1 Tax=Pseudonocardia sp. DSM 110487 TaxID=2865833 RepID=UPI001C69DB6E|nr:acyl-CoA dehydrogenase family protein [Pseudonocardia sp. DSM 110487]QYN33834.1 acyl-CoA dehydrogenase family protein [Pseudonocardia sp. DSM 110487]